MAQYQLITTTPDDYKTAPYIRPFLLFWLSYLFIEAISLAAGIFSMTGTRDLLYKVMWTFVFCPLGMGGTMGDLINSFIVDHYYEKKAAHFTGILTLHLGWFGASDHPIWFHWRYPALWVIGYMNGLLLFTDEEQARLARMKL
ncbi:unnamed protein product [Aspergillus oryzae RIB40]|uniref:DNA, SC005 n=3 Tax=Aspergillus oryzae TaxID=5062 RepID=Q2US63_ASPOR|nr:unnamed protein product [Aspergillus oryzae RIB40]EIT73989.1 hypothetical protein Ao3042_10072 [Aspergillus oryzae 3.042]KDE76973.1 hypothetical protein AO1008_02633 [Aspergillus oryzae 100-8]OOO13169.1 hypothetical protein OAory_01009180 [Aspergillus oryzae]BAE55602.1 unnamed protein product [Aspergillus oryzae RIB40]|eukprot:EIT73989.1 hypothetical protein Ao3042_10072 [Aspergillus oryzae 3.042]